MGGIRVSSSSLTFVFMSVFHGFSILSWNVRGVMNRGSQRHVLDILTLNRPAICMILEPQGPFDKMRIPLYRAGFEPIHIIECVGRAGGLWVLNNIGTPYRFSIIDVVPRMITFRVSRDSSSWLCTSIYANPYFHAPQFDWAHLHQVGQNITDPWVAIGDWNETIGPS